MTDAERLERAMSGECVGDVGPVLVAEIMRLRERVDRLARMADAAAREEARLKGIIEAAYRAANSPS